MPARHTVKLIDNALSSQILRHGNSFQFDCPIRASCGKSGRDFELGNFTSALSGNIHPELAGLECKACHPWKHKTICAAYKK